jgi:tRNA threonylcarbamoyladenosine biosynthesis protein TsaE
LSLVSVSVSDLVVAVASDSDAAAMVEVIHAAFGARPPLDPPSTAIDETVESVVASLGRGGGIFAAVAGRPAGVILVQPDRAGNASFQRVSVHPDFQRHGIASAMVTAAEELAATMGHQRVELFARSEFAELIAFWQHRGFTLDRPAPNGVILVRDLPVAVRVPTAAAMRRLGRRLATVLRSGDVIIASGELGAGKTTLTQGIGQGLGASGPIISPTFVLSRIHHSADDAPALVHVDAYRLGTASELDDLDLDATVPTAVTVVEWGRGVAEGLAESRLEIDLWTPVADGGSVDGDHERIVTLQGIGPRWQDADLRVLRGVVGDDHGDLDDE